MSAFTAFEHEVLRPLHRLARRAQWYVVLEGIATAVCVFVAAGAFQYATDRLLHLEIGPRAGLLLAAVAAVCIVLWRGAVRPILSGLAIDSVAAVLERRERGLRDALVSAVEFCASAGGDPRFNSPGLVAEAIMLATARFRSVPTRRVLNRRGLNRSLAGAALALVVVGAGAWSDPGGFAVFVSRNLLLSETPWPSNVRFHVEGFRNRALRYPRGDEWTLRVDVEGDLPRRGLRMQYESASGERGERVMTAVGERQYRLEFGPLEDSLTFAFLIGRLGLDERSESFEVVAVDRPAARALSVEVTPPAYTRQSAYRWPEGQTSGDVLIGATVTLTVTPSKALRAAAVRGGGTEIARARRIADSQWAATFVPARSGSYVFGLTDEEGLDDLHPVACSIRVARDRPPRVRLTLPGAGELVVPEAVLRTVLEAEDNIGLASAELVWRVERAESAGEASTRPATTQPSGGVERLIELEVNQPRFSRDGRFPLSGLSLSPGDRLTLFGRAFDFSPAEPSTRPHAAEERLANEGRSTIFTLRAATREELLAELARRESEWRQEFEHAIASQERIRDDSRAAGEGNEARPAGWTERRSYRALERQQRQLAARVKTIRTQFQGILAEMEINQLSGTGVQTRLVRGIIEPMGRLASTDMPDAADLLRQLDQSPDAAVLKRLEQAHDEIVRNMQRILARMLKWEGFNEAVGLLQELLKMQQQIHEETRRQLERQLDELLGEPTTKPGS
ncbi:MAG: hypothetical protein L6Q92_15595 [Phycisphaerae bacterium]|nr:hypothetical protein [Phycisphaerae bacterium]